MSEPRDETKAAATAATRIVLDDSWPSSRIILRVVVVVLLVLAAKQVVLNLTGIILLLILSVFFAYLISPLVEILHRPRPIAGRLIVIPRGVAIGIAYLIILAVIVFGIYFIVPQIASQSPQLAQQLQGYGKTISEKTQQLNEYFKNHKLPGGILDAANNAVPGFIETVGASVSILLSSVAGWVFLVPWVVLIPVLSFFMLKDAESFRRSALQMLPRGRWRWRGDEFFQDINSTLAAYTRAQLTACFFIGAVCAAGFAVVGLPSPLVLGLIAGIFEFVPLVGPLTIAILAAGVALLHSGFSSTLAVLIFLGVLRMLQDYVVYPRLIGHGIHLHPLAVIIAILCGAEMAGVAGIFLAIPVVAIVTVTYRHWLEHRGSERLADLLENDLDAVADDIAELIQEPVAGTRDAAALDEMPTHPTTETTPSDMARARPDLTTGELKMPEN